MFILAAMILVGWIFYLAATGGPRKALWLGWMSVLMFAPTWLTMNIGSIEMDLRTVAATAILAGFLLFPHGPMRYRWLWLDVLVLLLVASQIASGFHAGEIRPLTIPELFRRWLPAYIMGRLFLQSADDLDRVLPIAAKLMLAMTLLAIAEAVLKFNPVNELFGKKFAVLESGEGYRWGLKRAQGALIHPIFLGMMLVMLFPWALEACRRARHKEGPRWWLILPFLALGSVICTASRGAILAILFAVPATYFFRRPRWRILMILMLMIGGFTAYYGKQLVVESLSTMAGESGKDARIIVIDGEEVEYTGTKHRLLLYRVYAKAICEAGLFGYGIRMQGVPIEESLADRFSSIDNHYLLFLLQYGYFGIGAFVLTTAWALFYLAAAAWNPQLPQAGFAGTVFGSLLGVAVLLQTVWFAYDFAGAWLFSVGLAGSLYCLPRSVCQDRPETAVMPTMLSSDRNVFQPQLRPGWAPSRNTHEEDSQNVD